LAASGFVSLAFGASCAKTHVIIQPSRAIFFTRSVYRFWYHRLHVCDRFYFC
jgi:hypothetical protein